MGVGVCVSSTNNNNSVIKLNQLDAFVIDNFNYEEYAVDKEENNNKEKQSNHVDIKSLNNEEEKKVENVFENGNIEKKEEEKKEEEKIEENLGMIQEVIEVNQNENENKDESNLKGAAPKNNDKNEEKTNNDNNNIQNPNNQNIDQQKNIKKNKKIKLPDLFSIVSEKLLKESDGNELLFVSELSKMININVKERVKYAERFCMLTKDNFVIYNSKENYITLKRPLAVLQTKDITRVVLFKLNKLGNGFDHFYVCFNKTPSTELVYDQINTFFMNEKRDNRIGEDEALIMFKSNDKLLVKKWYVLLSYLIKLKKESNNNEEKNQETNA